MGFGSKMVVTGDITQIDLPHGNYSGLKHAQTVLENVPGIEFVYLNEADVVRHEIVGRIIKAYENYECGKSNSNQ
jgi:phosphate starvation-inducible PhoH-like protein